ACEMVEQGASWIDIGGQSTRPFSNPVDSRTEKERVIPVIKELKKILPSNIVMSIDTYYPDVAEEAIQNGADIVNDVTGLRNKEMINIIVKYRKPVVIMHMKGDQKTMQQNPCYDNVIKEINDFFISKIKELSKYNFDDIILDPGIGFGKNLEHNLTILKNLSSFKKLGFPIMIGPSRKSFIGMITGEKLPSKRVSGTIAACLYSYSYADIFRVHDVYEINQAFAVWKTLC
ncbi:MAG: dihydropteroate synthase, partial [Elusimicrobiales bacterium]